MKTLSRDAIQRMTGRGTSGNGGGGGGGSVDLTGYATESWVNENYLSIEFFSSLFKAYDSALTPNEIVPNGGDTTAITNIKAMFGFWTNQYISALGQNSGGGGGGATALTDLVDVAISNPSNGQVLKYNSTTNKWENANESGGGISMSDVWTALAASTSEQINASHLSEALNGYATQQWVGQQGFLTSSALNGYATQQWVGQQGFLTSSALNGYATQSWVGQQGFLTSSAISDMATKTWVSQQGYTTNTGTVTSITAGTGLSGGTITNSGTIGINSTYQSYITHGETAYGWGNHAGAGYLKSITSSMVTTALGYTPLSNATTFWGQTASSEVVSGDMTSVGSITMTGIVKMNRGTYISFRTSTSSTSYLSALGLNNSNALLIGVGTASIGNTVLYGTNIKFVSGGSSAVDAAELTTTGQLYVKQGAQGLRIGDALLTWDSTNKVLNLTNTTTSQTASFAASGGVSALGLSSEGNGGIIQNLTVTGTLTLGDTVIATTSPSIVRREKDDDCLNLFNGYTDSKRYSQKYYYNQYDNVGLLGKDYTWSNTTWWIDPDGCALFQRVYLSDNVYLFTDGSNIKVRIGSTVYTLTKS